MVGNALARIAQAYDFSMRAGIVIDDVSVQATADRFVIDDQHRANRDLGMLALSATRQLKRLAHPAKIVIVEMQSCSHGKLTNLASSSHAVHRATPTRSLRVVYH